jgi:hypothetical protein
MAWQFYNPPIAPRTDPFSFQHVKTHLLASEDAQSLPNSASQRRNWPTPKQPIPFKPSISIRQPLYALGVCSRKLYGQTRGQSSHPCNRRQREQCCGLPRAYIASSSLKPTGDGEESLDPSKSASAVNSRNQATRLQSITSFFPT